MAVNTCSCAGAGTLPHSTEACLRRGVARPSACVRAHLCASARRAPSQPGGARKRSRSASSPCSDPPTLAHCSLGQTRAASQAGPARQCIHSTHGGIQFTYAGITASSAGPARQCIHSTHGGIQFTYAGITASSAGPARQCIHSTQRHSIHVCRHHSFLSRPCKTVHPFHTEAFNSHMQASQLPKQALQGSASIPHRGIQFTYAGITASSAGPARQCIHSTQRHSIQICRHHSFLSRPCKGSAPMHTWRHSSGGKCIRVCCMLSVRGAVRLERQQ